MDGNLFFWMLSIFLGREEKMSEVWKIGLFIEVMRVESSFYNVDRNGP